MNDDYNEEDVKEGQLLLIELQMLQKRLAEKNVDIDAEKIIDLMVDKEKALLDQKAHVRAAYTKKGRIEEYYRDTKSNSEGREYFFGIFLYTW